MTEAAAGPLKRTPLHALHRELGARLVSFAGYEMPVQYPTGILAEHAQTRSAAGLFDVSHMGQVRLTAKPGHSAAKALEAIVPGDITGLQPGQQRYTQFTNETGGILDDLMTTSTGDHLLLVLNAACKDADLAHLRKHLSASCEIEPMFSRGPARPVSLKISAVSDWTDASSISTPLLCRNVRAAATASSIDPPFL